MKTRRCPAADPTREPEVWTRFERDPGRTCPPFRSVMEHARLVGAWTRKPESSIVSPTTRTAVGVRRVPARSARVSEEPLLNLVGVPHQPVLRCVFVTGALG